MSTAVFATLALVTLSSVSPGRPEHAVRRPGHRVPEAAVQSRIGDLYSARAKRRMASYLRLRLLEMREAGLDRAVQVIERRLPGDVLLHSP